MMQFKNSGWRAGFICILSLGIIGCHTTRHHRENAASKMAPLPSTVRETQTGSNLPRHSYVDEATKLADERRDREKKEKKAKRKPREKEKKTEKDKSVDEDYVPRGGFR